MEREKLVPVVCTYSFDSDTPVTLCESEEEAKRVLRDDYEEERRIQTEENGHAEGEDIICRISEDGTYACITISVGINEEPDRIEWTIGRIAGQHGAKRSGELGTILPDGRRLTAELIDDSSYPGIAVKVDGEFFVSSEYNKEDKKLKSYVYTKGVDEPGWIIDYDSGKDVS